MGAGRLIRRVRAVLPVAAACLAVLLDPGWLAAGDRMLIASGDLKAFVDSDPGWCRATVDVSVRAISEAPFKDDRIELQRLLGRIRLALEDECPAATTVRVIGFAGARRVFEGLAARDKKWVLSAIEQPAVQEAALPPSPPPQAATVTPPAPSSPAISTDPVTECDMLAAHRDDPQKTALAFVVDEQIDTAKAIAACGEAVKANPAIARLRFQLGRAYWAADRFEEAIETFIEAGNAGHGGALAYLGDAALYGVAGLDPDPETAKGLYQQAADARFKPAAALADEIVKGVEIAEHKPEPVYRYPAIVSVLVAGTPPFRSEMRAFETMLYVAWVLSGVTQHCLDAMPPDYEFAINIKLALDRTLAGRTFREQLQVNAAYEAGQFDALEQAGLDDGYAVAFTRGCQAAETVNLVKAALRYIQVGPWG